jgi:hypothetical protein
MIVWLEHSGLAGSVKRRSFAKFVFQIKCLTTIIPLMPCWAAWFA